MERSTFREELLVVMEAKRHWAWPHFTGGQVAANKMHIHFEQEYATYVRDFPVMLGWAFVQCPIAQVRRELAENLYEEETGQLVAGKPHPELFLEYPRGLGMALDRFDEVVLLPGAARYRAWLDLATQSRGWEIATAVTTLFLEGTPYERGELDVQAPKRPTPPLAEHPLVVHYGLSVEHLALTKAHRAVEGSHRAAAWRILLDAVPGDSRISVVAAMRETLVRWLDFRDGVAQACGLSSKTS